MTLFGWLFQQGMRVLRRPSLRPHALRALVTGEEQVLLDLGEKGYLAECGWIRSQREQRSVDGEGNPVPWCTYAYIQFIEDRLTTDMKVFEYGSGFSTRFYAARVGEVDAVEHEKEWVDLVKQDLPDNAGITYQPFEPDGAYCRQAQENGPYDLIVVDGRDRVNCLKQSLSALASNGLVVLDNSQRAKYQPGITFMLDAGFRRIDFHGISPMKAESNITTLFYRTDNVFGL